MLSFAQRQVVVLCANGEKMKHKEVDTFQLKMGVLLKKFNFLLTYFAPSQARRTSKNLVHTHSRSQRQVVEH